MARNRINKAEVGFLIAAALLPLVVVWVNWSLESSRRPTYQKVKTEWFSGEWPCPIHENTVLSRSGIRLASGTDGRRVVAQALVPAPASRDMLLSIHAEGKGMERALSEMFPALPMEIRRVTGVVAEGRVSIEGVLYDSKKPFAAEIQALADVEEVMVLLVGAERKTDARNICAHIWRSLEMAARPAQ